MSGRDVLAIQRALILSGDRKKPASRHFGRRCKRNVKRYQRRHNLTADGQVGPRTFNVMKRHHLFDGYGVWLLDHTKKPKPPPQTKRDKIVRFAWWCHANSGHFSYLQQRPMQNFACPPQVNWNSDCSEWVTNAYWCSGAPDPCGYGYSGWGNTSSMVYNPAGHDPGWGGLQPGDVLLYSAPDHCVIYVGKGKVLSHGSAGIHYLNSGYRYVTSKRAYLG